VPLDFYSSEKILKTEKQNISVNLCQKLELSLKYP